jgi:Ca-activated chloride channel family protein
MLDQRALIFSALIAFLVALPQSLAQSKPHRGNLFSPDKSSTDRDTSRIVIRTEMVSLTVSVTDGEGRHRAGLRPEDFLVLDNNVPQEISFFSDHDAPASIAIVFDVSGSITREKLWRAKEALRRFIQTSHREDQYFLITFNSSAELLVDGAPDGESLLRSVAGAAPSGHTALYDAVALGIQKLSHARYPKRALVLMSDGEDNRSRASFGQIRQQLREAAISIYSVGTDPHPLPRSQGRFILSELASVSGGRVYFPPRPEEMNEVFEKIALELRHQYSIGYTPSNFVPDGSWHRVKVSLAPALKPLRARVRTREGYQATTRLTSATRTGSN